MPLSPPLQSVLKAFSQGPLSNLPNKDKTRSEEPKALFNLLSSSTTKTSSTIHSDPRMLLLPTSLFPSSQGAHSKKKDKALKLKERKDTKPHKSTQSTQSSKRWSWRTPLKNPKPDDMRVSKVGHIRMWLDHGGRSDVLVEPKSKDGSNQSWLVKRLDDNKERHLTKATNTHECAAQYHLHQDSQNRQKEQQQPHQAPWFNTTIAIHDIFGIGKATEMALGLFLAHDAFLSRRPFKLQCAILIWEGTVVLAVLWAVLRVVGLAEVVVWGADDLARGTIGAIRTLGQGLILIGSRIFRN